MSLLIGDLIRVAGKWALYHYYVYVGPIGLNGEDLFHVDTQRGACLVHHSVLADEQVKAVIPPKQRQHPAMIQGRALEVFGRPYHETLFNCEQGATYVQTGVTNSHQLNFIVGVGIIALVVLATKKSKR